MIPPACNSINQAIKSLESERSALQADLHEASPGQKPAIVAQIKQLNTQISKKKAALKACVLANA